jgi:ornithine cyclodeaminase/alanine dehydrogenase-like protein (mu-crystallin family)
MPTLFLTDADVSALGDWGAAIDALRRAYAARIDPASVPPRTMARLPGTWLRSLTAISPLEGHLGCKLIAASYTARRASYLLALFEPDTLSLAALIDANQITGIRTAATAAVAVDVLAPRDPLKVAMIGSGFEAHAQLTALAAARGIAGATVFSPTPANRERFADHFRAALGIEVRAVGTPA